ncbi:hypothetical protein BN946_scf184977.g60 [Trametes cinnabarina]|uniref:Uncharacterized protein n=1 Tax=Pycnoporus cinnabarinus TaxID=5643 RepID=A0A060SIW5_PYCCI|nr:hypothetical protein BN946_scf184977.g60 [Trametes cinnabarina]
MEGEDRLVSVIPVHLTNALEPNLHLHQYPLLTRPLEVPPSAAASGKRIRARVKPKVKRLEVHVPVDTRPEVWNAERSKELGAARVEDDKEKNQELAKVKQREGEEPRLTEVRMRSEQVPQMGVYVLGVLREGRLHLHPISETHQFRPTLTYMDMHTRKTRRTRGDDSDEDDGPPPDPDEPVPAPAPKKEKKPPGDAKEVQVAIRKTGEVSGLQFQGGMTQVRRDMLTMIHAEEDEQWDDYEYCGGEWIYALWNKLHLQDERLHKTIQNIYERLLGFLELVSAAQYESPVDAIGIQPALSAILSESTLILLLEFRVLFRNIASRHVAASSAGVTICWVDVVLARLGQSIVCAAGMFGDVKSEDANQPEALRAQKEDDMLRAAIQLPGKWRDVVGVIGSKYASPAAARLASTLAWGVYVMTEKLSGNRSVMTQEIKAYLSEALQRRLKQVGLKRTQRVDAHMVAESERFTDAIVVSLCLNSTPITLNLRADRNRMQLSLI